jgi:hypothetical protein
MTGKSSTHSFRTAVDMHSVQVILALGDARNVELVTDVQAHVSDVMDMAMQTDGLQCSGFVSQVTTGT